MTDQNATEVENAAFDAEHTDRIQNKFSQLLESGKHSDVTFIVDSEDGMVKIAAHRAILASQSEYFDRLLYGEMKEAYPGAEIPLSNISLEAFQVLLRYIYSGRMRITAPNLQLKLDVATLADRFSFGFLKNTFDMHLASAVTFSNALQIFMHADVHSLQYSKVASLDFIDHNAKSVLESDDLLHLTAPLLEHLISRDTFLVKELNIFRAVWKWVEYNNKTKEDVASLLGSVRLCEMSPQELFDEVEPSNLYKRDAIFEAMRIQQRPEWNCTQPRGRINDSNLFENEKTSCQYSSESKTNPHWMDGDASSTWGIKVAGNHFDLSEGSVGYGTRIRQPPTSVLIKFEDVYLVNHISLQLLAPVSYSIQISNDNKQWRKLFNYTNFTCSGEQQLYFPKQAIQYIHFAPLSDDKDCRVKLCSCSLNEYSPSFTLRDRGILAPDEPFVPATIQSSRRNRNGLPLCQVTFKQPYTINVLRFKLLGKGAVRDGDKIDGTAVVYILSGKGSQYTQVAHLSDSSLKFGSQLELKFPERTVNHVCVMLKPTGHEEEPAAKKLKVNEDSLTLAVLPDFTVTGLTCWTV